MWLIFFTNIDYARFIFIATLMLLLLQVIEAKWWQLPGAETYGNSNIEGSYEEKETFLTWFWAIIGIIGGLVLLWRCCRFCYTLCIDDFGDLEDEHSAGLKSEKRASLGSHTVLPQRSVE